jgi:hypothetical protein
MGYFIDADGNYPRHAGDVQLIVPDWQEGVDALPDGWQEVEPGIIPELAQYEYVVEDAPAVVDGVLTRQFHVERLTDEQIAKITAPNI